MSYSFTISAGTKAEAKVAIAAEFDKVLGYQPVHSKDRDQAQAAAFAFIDVLDDDAGKNVGATVKGYLSGSLSTEDGPPTITGASVTVNAYLSAR